MSTATDDLQLFISIIFYFNQIDKTFNNIINMIYTSRTITFFY